VGEDRTGEPQANHERLTVAQAAARLGITEGAVRSRIKRGTLDTAKEGNSVFVLLGDGTSQTNQATSTGVPNDQSALIEALRDQIEDLRQERDEWREQARIADRLLSAAMERIPPQLEAPQEPPEDAETVEEAREELDTERARREMAEATMHEGMDEERRRREEAERERDELRRELYARRETPEAAETAEEQQGRDQPHPATGGTPVSSEDLGARGSGTARGSWWRRLLGG
jgi:type IV secretory pathway VirB10-like protein